MHTLFLIGNIASGKSTAARYLESRGAWHLDLDAMAKELYVPGSELVADIAEVFGWDVLSGDGTIKTRVLAERAFETPEQTERLNALVHPALLAQLSHMLLPANCCSTMVPEHPLAVVEVSAPVGFQDAFGLADDVIAITASYDIRRRRALERGMSLEDFERRASVQPSESELCALAHSVIDNTHADDTLFDALDAWISSRGLDESLSRCKVMADA